MQSEVITVVAAVIGIVGDLLAIAGYLTKKHKVALGYSIPILNSLSQKFYAYLFSSATWVLVVLVWFLGFQPYGSLVTDRELNQLIAIMMSMPVIVGFLFSTKHLFSGSGNET